MHTKRLQTGDAPIAPIFGAKMLLLFIISYLLVSYLRTNVAAGQFKNINSSYS